MTAKNVGEAGENPLVPNAKLRQMYSKMLEARMLEEAVAKRMAKKGKKKRTAVNRGQEAVRVSTTIDLTQDDLVSDAAPTAGMGLLLGGDPALLLRELTHAKAEWNKVLLEAGVSQLLRGTGDEEERLRLAVGAALALKTQGRRGIVVAYARKGEMAPSAWRRILSPAQKLDLPIVFVVLARGAQKKGTELTEVCKSARAVGVPAIPVDSCDAVALYRVTQESLGRTRSGDGPILIESVSWRIKGNRDSVDDPLDHLKESLLARKICNDTWFEQLAKTTRGLLLRPSAASKKA